MYAVIESGGKQYRVELGSEIQVDRLDVQPGDSITLDRVLLVADGDVTAIGQPVVDGALVSADVLGQDRGDKIVVFKYKPKARHRVKKGFRAELTTLRISDIAHAGHSAAKDADKTATDEAKAARAADKAAADKAAADKALAAKLAASQPAEAAVDEPTAADEPETRKSGAKAKASSTTKSDAEAGSGAEATTEPDPEPTKAPATRKKAKTTADEAEAHAATADASTDETEADAPATEPAADAVTPNTDTKKDE